MMLSNMRQRGTALAGAALRKQAGATAGSTRILSDYIERQNKTGRPVSPHVTAYRFPVVAISSITNRVTGVGLVGGLYGIGALALVGVDVQGLMAMLGETAVAPLAKMVVTFPLIYHYLGAARHTIWDFKPETVNNASVAQSSYILFGAAGGLTLLTAVV